MNEEIFRKKSLDQVKSPESLDDYIRVANPGVWLLLISIIVLLAGACIWGFFGHIDSTAPAAVYVENGKAVCTIAEEDLSSVKVGQTVKWEKQEAVIKVIGEKSDGGYVCTLDAGNTLSDGFYEGEVVMERYKPLSFILN